jgi:hypothetical protein
MAYRVELPPDIAKDGEISSGLSLPKNTGKSGKDGKDNQTIDATEGRIIAVLIASEVLGCDIWFALDDSFDPKDGKAVFYADELAFLATKDATSLREIHKVKLAFRGSRVRQ